MSLINVASNISALGYSKRFKGTKAKLNYQTTEMLETNKLIVRDLVELLKERNSYPDIPFVKQLTNTKEPYTGGMMFLPTDKLKSLVEAVKESEDKHFYMLASEWAQNGLLNFPPYILRDGEKVTLVMGVFEFCRLEDAQFMLFTYYDESSFVALGKQSIRDVLSATGSVESLKNSELGAIFCMSALFITLANSELKELSFYENFDILYEFMRASTAQQGCAFDESPDDMLSLFTFTDIRTAEFPYYMITADDVVACTFAVSKTHINMYTDSEFGAFKIPVCLQSTNKNDCRKLYLDQHKFLQRVLVFMLGMQNILITEKEVYVQGDIPRFSSGRVGTKAITNLHNLYEIDFTGGV